jgi:hypothetical protein
MTNGNNHKSFSHAIILIFRVQSKAAHDASQELGWLSAPRNFSPMIIFLREIEDPVGKRRRKEM